MQNSALSNSLLQAHINNITSKDKTSAYQNFSAPKPNLINDFQTENDAFVKKQPDDKKQKIAELSLLSALGLGSLIGVGLIIKRRGFSLSKIKSDIPDISKGLDNITNVKDTLIRKMFGRFKPYNAFDNKVAQLYRESGSKTVIGGYQKAQRTFASAEELTREIAENAGQNLDKGALDRLIELLGKKTSCLETFASKESVANRIQELDNAMKGMDKNSWKKLTGFIKDRKYKEGLHSLMTESIVADRVTDARKFQEKMTEAFRHAGLSQAEQAEFETILETMRKNGDSKALKMIKKADKLYNKAFTKETVDLVQKLRDINCGSGATDIEGIIGTLGLLSIYTAQADSTEEKVGVTLTTGVPLAVTLGTTLVAACKLISGGKALGLGLLTGFIAKTVGGAINSKYQQAKGQKEGEGTIITLDDYVRKIKDI